MNSRSLLVAATAAAAVTALTVPVTNVTFNTRACQPPFDTLPFCNPSLPVDDRVADLIARIWAGNATGWIPPQLTARHETQGQPFPNSNISALGLPEYDWGMNAIHGVQSSCVRNWDGQIYCPTSFANPVTIGSAWNASLVYDMGSIIGIEARGLWLAGATEYNGNPPPHIGLDAWSPNINIARDPRWGRNQEVASEDPLLNGDFGVAYTLGIQSGPDPRYIQTVVTLKHWDAYSLENSDGYTRYNFDANVSAFALSDTYYPAFKRSVLEGGAMGVMCSYNAVNGIPTCASAPLTAALRGEWGFDGYITSDSGAINAIFAQHKYVPNATAAACVAIRDGTTDVNSGQVYSQNLMFNTDESVCPGGMAAINASLARTFKLRYQLGLFDPADKQPYWNVPLSAIGTQEAAASSLFAAESGMVLLKNSDASGAPVLPLTPGKRVAIIGPHANAQMAMLGNYLGQMCPNETRVGDFSCVPNLSQGIGTLNNATNGGSTAVLTALNNVTSNNTADFAAALALAQSSDIVILALGIDGTVENEMLDRSSIDLPAAQHQLAALIASAGKPTVIVLLNGGSLDVSAERDNSAIGAIVYAGYPGRFGAAAIANTLFGGNTHLGGKLATTWYPASYVSSISMSEMELDVGPGRGYRFYSGPTVFPFGFGLALTTFSFQPAAFPLQAHAEGTLVAGTGGLLQPPRQLPSLGQRGWISDRRASQLALSSSSSASAPYLSYSVLVTNTGGLVGDTVVQGYFSPSLPSLAASLSGSGYSVAPLLKQLFGYQRVHLLPGESAVVTFNVTAATMRMVDREGGDVLSVAGRYTITFTDGNDAVPSTTGTSTSTASASAAASAAEGKGKGEVNRLSQEVTVLPAKGARLVIMERFPRA